ncbi:MAG: UDP-N-acetylmuramate--L-alanine ligase [candidate division Zixibacteria bacterium]|nr:UDP-N-acetylmuramate--L-alanine ligase [candidate division Zixibacteria bacterium]
MIFSKYKKLHFVGIGGAGMSGMAKILHNLGYTISGSDNTPTEVTEHLESIGITIYSGHSAQQVTGTDLLVISSAVNEENPEVVEALESGIPVIKRAEMLGELMRLKFSIGISGSHGKTTTTAMLGKILMTAKVDPTVLVGGRAMELDSGGQLGQGEIMVAEADEYDRSFLKMYPSIAVITNIEEDHLDCYDGLDDLLDTFAEYVNRVPFYGSVVIPSADMNVTRIKDIIKRPIVTFGFDDEADIRAVEIEFTDHGSRYVLVVRGEVKGHISLSIPGEYNIANSLAAIAAALEIETPMEAIEDGLRAFKGVGRRFEIIAQVKGVTVIDDYAHHPSEVAATLTGINESTVERSGKTIAIFQPHLFSRTRDFYKQFAESLHTADEALVVDIYPAREKPIAGITSEMITEYAQSIGYKNLSYVGLKENAVERAVALAQTGDIIITMGAGDIFRINDKIIKALEA